MESGIEEDWEMVDYSPPSHLKDLEQQKSELWWLSVINVGKKVVIGGLVLTSLPFVLPPLMVISALGLAVSVPYGVVLASYACTHKLMTKLLPSPEPTHQHELQGFEDLENEFDEIREEEQEGYKNLEDVMEKEQKSLDDFNVNEGENFVQEKSEKDEDKENGTNDKQGEDLIIIETKREENDEDKENEKLGEDFLQEKNINETKREEKDEGEENVTNEKEREIIINETKKDESKENGTKQEKITNEAKREEKNEQVEKMKRGSKETAKQRKKKKSEGKRKDGEGDPPKLESAGEVIIQQEESSKGIIHEKIEVMVQDDSGGVAVNYIESTVIADDGKGTELKEEKDIHSEDQESFSEEKIWEKIDAIREITGLKTPKHDSYYEELKALYLFTGIEAPSISLDTPDFVEFYSKLSFLMSVIGLK